MAALTCSKLSSWILFAIALQIIGICIFVIGFFPVKPTLHGISGLESYEMPTCENGVEFEQRYLSEEKLRSLYTDISGLPPAFDRLILMVVDGLPAEFVLGRDNRPPSNSMVEAMPYTQYLLSKGNALAYHAKAAPPTVTMPRLKAIVSGAIGGFLDVAFNFNTQAFLDDNLLDQFYRIGWKMVMLGDETWIKLFPGIFTRHDGVSSFYVKDTVEVDFNVSRHLEVELARSDWELLILHYLGLDHVGHIGGRQSVLMAPKMKEMDDVIKLIHENKILHQDNLDKHTLLVVVSDHGMTDSGNHGGSSYEETDSLAIFIGLDAIISNQMPNAHNAVSQVDVAPTLALLFGVPIPKNNIGVLLQGVLATYNDKQKLRALELNSWQLLRLLQAHLPGLLCSNLSQSIPEQHDIQESLLHLFVKASAAHSLWELHQKKFESGTAAELGVAVKLYYEFLINASTWLSHRATNKPLHLLLSGVTIISISCCLLLYLLMFMLKNLQPKENESHNSKWHFTEAFIYVGILLHAGSLSSSSFVEEEQYTWHFLSSTLYLMFLLKTIQSLLSPKNYKGCYQIVSLLIVLICLRLLRGWHQGGINFVDLPDISKWLEQVSDIGIKYLNIFSLLILVIVNLFGFSFVRPMSIFVNIVIFSHLVSGLLVYLHILKFFDHAYIPSSNAEAQLFYLIISVMAVLTASLSPWIQTLSNEDSLSVDNQIDSCLFGIRNSLYLNGMTYIASWGLLQLLLQQPVNSGPTLLIFLQLFGSLIYFSADGSNQKEVVEVVAMCFLGMACHFGLGNSNSLATIDVAGAFIGISSHSTILSGILMFISTHASPLLLFLGMILYISLKKLRYQSCTEDTKLGCILQNMIAFPCLLPLVLNSVVLTAFTIVLLLMRNHLFIWSVFSPKYLYVCAMTLSVYIGVSFIGVISVYVCSVVLFRVKKLNQKVHTS